MNLFFYAIWPITFLIFAHSLNYCVSSFNNGDSEKRGLGDTCGSLRAIARQYIRLWYNQGLFLFLCFFFCSVFICLFVCLFGFLVCFFIFLLGKLKLWGKKGVEIDPLSVGLCSIWMGNIKTVWIKKIPAEKTLKFACFVLLTNIFSAIKIFEFQPHRCNF